MFAEDKNVHEEEYEGALYNPSIEKRRDIGLNAVYYWILMVLAQAADEKQTERYSLGYRT